MSASFFQALWHRLQFTLRHPGSCANFPAQYQPPVQLLLLCLPPQLPPKIRVQFPSTVLRCQGKSAVKPRLLLISLLAVLATVALAGCDDHVIVDRDSSIPIHKGMTWAWRPAGPPPSARRPVASRDYANRPPAYSNAPTYQRNSYWENDIVRNRIARSIEVELNSRGLHQVSDPNEADFLVDYQFAVQPRRERVAT